MEKLKETCKIWIDNFPELTFKRMMYIASGVIVAAFKGNVYLFMDQERFRAQRVANKYIINASKNPVQIYEAKVSLACYSCCFNNVR